MNNFAMVALLISVNAWAGSTTVTSALKDSSSSQTPYQVLHALYDSANSPARLSDFASLEEIESHQRRGLRQMFPITANARREDLQSGPWVLRFRIEIATPGKPSLPSVGPKFPEVPGYTPPSTFKDGLMSCVLNDEVVMPDSTHKFKKCSQMDQDTIRGILGQYRQSFESTATDLILKQTEVSTGNTVIQSLRKIGDEIVIKLETEREGVHTTLFSYLWQE